MHGSIVEKFYRIEDVFALTGFFTCFSKVISLLLIIKQSHDKTNMRLLNSITTYIDNYSFERMS